MSSKSPSHEAAASLKGSIHHLYVAVEKCYQLRKGEKLLIEEFGDITIENDSQIEVKHYSDVLTDGHKNFWNTVKNWLDCSFDHTPYKFLVLHTNQEFGAKATLSGWNEFNIDQRLSTLIAIKESSEEKLARAKTKEKNLDKAPSVALTLQRIALSDDNSLKLRGLIGKISIESGSMGLPDLFEELKQDRVRGVPRAKKDDYLNSLFGFVCRADARPKVGERWEITYEQFEAKISNLNSTYNNDTNSFPRKYFDLDKEFDPESISTYDFVRKIKDIDYEVVVSEAVHDYESTLLTITEEFENYTIDPKLVEGYANDVKKRFNAAYRTAERRCTNEIADSQDLYDSEIGRSAVILSGFGDTPDGFRNGVLHQSMEDPAGDYKWRLKKNE